ncbi:hypothetical protein [Saccharibacillus sp. O23]|uniref:hypothetical protein n=1 Tax=Saccharibacillus sp. O23 TaxID=2009338 RepID=UPI00117A6F6E|nr:hypothetical protein [Saccharibacillus sp. O23]
MQMNRLEYKVLGMLRRHRWSRFRKLSMTELIRRSGGAFREVTVALINLEQGGYLHWHDKSSLRHIGLLRRAYGPSALLPWFVLAADGEIDPISADRSSLGQEQKGVRINSRPIPTRQPSKRRRSAD